MENQEMVEMSTNYKKSTKNLCLHVMYTEENSVAERRKGPSKKKNQELNHLSQLHIQLRF